MGMAPYGEPKYVDLIRDHLIEIRKDGSFHLNMNYFNYCTGLTMTNERFSELFGEPRRDPALPLSQKHMDLAKSVQVVLEDAVLTLIQHLYEKTGEKNLCMAGGVALNCVANGRISREGPFDNIWIQPAAGDAGSSLGVALAISNAKSKGERLPALNSMDAMHGAYLGPEYSEEEIQDTMEIFGAKFEKMIDDTLFPFVAEKLAKEKIVGWFQGRMEFGTAFTWQQVYPWRPSFARNAEDT